MGLLRPVTPRHGCIMRSLVTHPFRWIVSLSPGEAIAQASVGEWAITTRYARADESTAVPLDRLTHAVDRLTGRHSVADHAAYPGRNVEHTAVLHALIHRLTQHGDGSIGRHAALQQFRENEKSHRRPRAVGRQ